MVGEVFHHKVGESLVIVKVQSLIEAYVYVIEFLYMDEISLGLQQDLFRNFEFFDSKDLFIDFVLASINTAIRSFPKFFKQLVFIIETVIKQFAVVNR